MCSSDQVCQETSLTLDCRSAFLMFDLSTISSAAFAAGFLEVILIFKTCQNAPFRAYILGMIKSELHRNKVIG